MPLMNPDTPNRESRLWGRLTRWGRRIAAATVLLAAVFFALRWLVPTPEERLAAFDAAHAVPEEDNAALIYAELLQGQEVPADKLAPSLTPLLATLVDPASLQESNALMRNLRELDLSEGITDANAARTIGSRPWKSAECPELKQWIDGRRNRIDRLQEAAGKARCYFPVSSTRGYMSLFEMPLGAFQQSVFLLNAAANNDLGEGDIDAGLAKCEAVMVIGRHLGQQPGALHLLGGIVCEGTTIYRLAPLVVEGSVGDRHLNDLAALCGDLDDRWKSLRRDINYVRGIYSHLLDDPRPASVRAYTWFQRVCLGDHAWNEARARELYFRLLSDRRGLRLLIELRRFRDRTGHWPPRLDPIAAFLPPQAFVDPISNSPFVYRLSEHGFSLYSIGPNRIDEKGQRRAGGPDDWPIWPPRGRSPELKQ